jgi:hypothetical protein
MTGWYDSTGFHDAANVNYEAEDPTIACPGGCAGASNIFAHDFFSFRLGNGIITGTVTAATLAVANPAGGYAGPVAGMQMSLWDVTTPVGTLNASSAAGAAGIAIWNDLASGVLYSQRTVSGADNNTNIVYTLDASALAAIQSAAGPQGSSLFAIGGALNPAVPEPGTWMLMGAGLLGVLLRWRRR